MTAERMTVRDRLVGWWLDVAPSFERRGFAAYPMGRPWGFGVSVSGGRDHVGAEVHVLCFTYAVQWEAGF